MTILNAIAMETILESPVETRVVEIGGVAIALRTSSPAFARLIEDRYASFVNPVKSAGFSTESSTGIVFDIELFESAEPVFDESFYNNLDNNFNVNEEPPEQQDDLDVVCEGGVWRIQRRDFFAQWDSKTGRGQIRQTMTPYALDAILRIVHTLVLARQGEFLVHSASAIRNGRAFLFSGVSGAGKTTISRLAPPDATLLTDEISYIRKDKDGDGLSYRAYGTPFAGELGRLGENCSAPLQALYLLSQGSENRIDELHPALATQALLRNILFFARDAEQVQCVFEGACEFVERVPVRRLTFRKDAAVWDLIG
jgi:hypothetical protein